MSFEEDRDFGASRAAQAVEGVPEQLPDCVKEPCSECPWRRDSAPGWLGPQTSEEWILTAHSDTPIMCHKTIKESGSYDGTKQCRGAAIFRANVCKSPRRSDIVTGPPDTENVFATNDEFLAHHNQNRVLEVEGWKTGDRVTLLTDKEFCFEGDEGEIEIEQVGSPLYHNLALKIFFKPDGSDEAIQEVSPEEIEAV